MVDLVGNHPGALVQPLDGVVVHVWRQPDVVAPVGGGHRQAGNARAPDGIVVQVVWVAAACPSGSSSVSTESVYVSVAFVMMASEYWLSSPRSKRTAVCQTQLS